MIRNEWANAHTKISSMFTYKSVTLILQQNIYCIIIWFFTVPNWVSFSGKKSHQCGVSPWIRSIPMSNLICSNACGTACGKDRVSFWIIHISDNIPICSGTYSEDRLFRNYHITYRQWKSIIISLDINHIEVSFRDIWRQITWRIIPNSFVRETSGESCHEIIHFCLGIIGSFFTVPNWVSFSGKKSHQCGVSPWIRSIPMSNLICSNASGTACGKERLAFACQKRLAIAIF